MIALVKYRNFLRLLNNRIIRVLNLELAALQGIWFLQKSCKNYDLFIHSAQQRMMFFETSFMSYIEELRGYPVGLCLKHPFHHMDAVAPCAIAVRVIFVWS